MKREDLTALGITDSTVVDKIMEAHGKDITKLQNSVNTLTTERDGLNTRLGEANGKLEGYDPEWKTKAETAKTTAETKLKDMQYDFAVKGIAGNLKFTSKAAESGFVSALKAKKLPLQEDGKILGFDDFKTGYEKEDPGAFLSDKTPPKFSDHTDGPANKSLAGNEKANDALRAAFK